jgi:hypothetical protein
MGRIVEGLLTLARSDAGAIELQRERLDLASLNGEVARPATGPRGRPPGVSSALDLRAPGPVPGTFDTGLMTPAGTWNLIRECPPIRRSRGTGPDLRPPPTVRMGGSSPWRIRAPGFRRGSEDRVFERFWRGDPSRTQADGAEGSGLGLAIVTVIADAHGGSVTVSNRFGAGGCPVPRSSFPRGPDPRALPRGRPVGGGGRPPRLCASRQGRPVLKAPSSGLHLPFIHGPVALGLWNPDPTLGARYGGARRLRRCRKPSGTDPSPSTPPTCIEPLRPSSGVSSSWPAGSLRTGPALDGQTDFYNLDKDRPLRVEDAYAAKRHAFEFQASPFTLSQDRAGVLRYQPSMELKHGLLPGLEASVGLALDRVRDGSDTSTSLGEVDLSALLNLWVEGAGPFPPPAIRVTGAPAHRVRSRRHLGGEGESSPAPWSVRYGPT